MTRKYALSLSEDDLITAIKANHDVIEHYNGKHCHGCEDALSNLSVLQAQRFELTKSIEDLNEAVINARFASILRPSAPCFSNYGIVLFRRFLISESPSDVRQSVIALQEAVHRTPKGHSARVARLYNVCIATKSQYELRKDVGDLITAIDAMREVLDLSLVKYPEKQIAMESFRHVSFHRDQIMGGTDLAKAVLDWAVDLESEAFCGFVDWPVAPISSSGLDGVVSAHNVLDTMKVFEETLNARRLSDHDFRTAIAEARGLKAADSDDYHSKRIQSRTPGTKGLKNLGRPPLLIGDLQ